MAIYDSVNAYEVDTQPRFYTELATELDATSIVDLGCGTGLITRALAARGHTVVGVEPSALMLDVARRGEHAGRVRWIHGDAGALGAPGADLAIMTGHVAQFFVTDASWRAALVALHESLRPGGRLAFETRNPDAREWEHWTRAASVTVDDPQAGHIETWSELHRMHDGIASYAVHYAFAATGEELTSRCALRFRTLPELHASLTEAGFTIERAYGDWDRRPAGPRSRELIVVAARR